MIQTSFFNAKINLDELCNRVVKESDIAVINRENNQNLVLMSKKQYDNLVENTYIKSGKVNYDML